MCESAPCSILAVSAVRAHLCPVGPKLLFFCLDNLFRSRELVLVLGFLIDHCLNLGFGFTVLMWSWTSLLNDPQRVDVHRAGVVLLAERKRLLLFAHRLYYKCKRK